MELSWFLLTFKLKNHEIMSKTLIVMVNSTEETTHSNLINNCLVSQNSLHII